MKILLKQLIEHSWNKEVFFNIEGVEYASLKDDIKERGLQLPIHITSSIKIGRHKPFTIINGHQRVRVLKELGLKEIEAVVRRDLNTEDKIDEQFISDNILRRHLNPIQIANASDKLLEIEQKRAEERQKATQLKGKDEGGNPIGGGKITVTEKGEALEIVAKKFGKSRKTLETYRAARDLASKNKGTMKALMEGTKSAHSIVKEQKAKEQRLSGNKPAYFLPFRLKHKQLIENGKKIQTSRIRWVFGATKDAIGSANVVEPIGLIKIKSVVDKKLGDFTIEDAKREGYSSLEDFKKIWIELHNNWNPNLIVRVYNFELVKHGKGN